MADVVNNLDTAQNFDAEVFKEEIAEGETKGIKVDLDADYDAAQAMSQGSLSASEAKASVAPEQKVSKPEDVKIASQSASESVDYAGMAKDMSSTSSGTSNVTDDVVEKALQMGQSEK